MFQPGARDGHFRHITANRTVRVRLRCVFLTQDRRFHTANNSIRIGILKTTLLFNHRRDIAHGMMIEQLQDSHVMSDSKPLLQATAQVRKRLRQLPVAHYRRMIQSSGTARKTRQIVARIQYFSPFCVTSDMGGNDLIFADYLDAIDKAFDRHRPEGNMPRDAVTHTVKTRHLVLVNDDIPADTRLKTMSRKRC